LSKAGIMGSVAAAIAVANAAINHSPREAPKNGHRRFRLARAF
jgi:hypothetical protein